MEKHLNKKTSCIVVNLISGPGTGKSILASEVFSALKREFISCDISHEYIKKKLREKALKAVESQIYIFAKQQFQLFSMKDEVEVVVTDSPLIFSAIYDKTKCQFLKGLILKEFNKYNNINYLLFRDTDVPYEQEGRYQDSEGAKKVDTQMLDFLNAEGIEYKPLYGIGKKSLNIIINDVKEKLAKQ